MATATNEIEIGDPRVAAAPTVAARRIRWIDVARGMAILLVVFGHAAGGLIDAAGKGSMPTLRYVFLAIYTFHMPLFFLLSGMFFEQRMHKGSGRFFSQLLITIAYPYFLWSIIQFGLIFSLGSIVNHPAGQFFPTILALPWQSVSQFWFLQALFLINLLCFAAWKIGGVKAMLGAALLAKLFALFVPTTAAISLAASNAPYFALGGLIGWRRASDWLVRTPVSARIAIMLGAAAVVTLLAINANAIQPYITIETASSAGIAKVAWIPAMLPATLLAGAALLLLAESVSRSDGWFAATIEYFGMMSMPIFLLHVMFVAGLRIGLSRLAGIEGIEALPLLVLVGIGGPLLVRLVTDRMRLTRLLALR